MSQRFLPTCLALIALATSGWSAAKYPFPRSLDYRYGTRTTVSASYASAAGTEIQTAFEYWKSNLVDSSGSYMRVKFDDTTMTVSEGIGYGMLIMVYMDNSTNNTQGEFDKLWAYYQHWSNGNGLMNWKVQGFNSVNQQNGATDADLDVALALTMAYKQWGTASYLSSAKTLIASIYKNEVTGGRLKPGDAWDSYENPVGGHFKGKRSWALMGKHPERSES
jgi:endo-1,4-beta-D-glucanase Y